MEQKRGLGDIYADESEYNANEQQINKAINKINTSWIGKVVSCSSEGVGGSKSVVAVPVVATVDGQGNQQPAVNYVELPHYRVTAGVGAVIIDPQPGDLGLFMVCKRNGSKSSAQSTETQTPGSFRQFNMADSVMVATIKTKDPEVYIHIKPVEKQIDVVAPEGYTLNTNQSVSVNAGKDISLVCGGDFTIAAGGNVKVTGSRIDLN